MTKRQENDDFQNLAGVCLAQLERYKLKTNLIGCNLKKQEFDMYYNYYSQKPKTRLKYARSRVEELVKTFDKQQIYLQALQLKSINNMIRNFRKRMDLLTNQPTDFNYAKFQKQEGELLSSIVLNDTKKKALIERIYEKIKAKDKLAMETLQEKLKESIVPPNFQKCVNSMSRAEVRYCRFYQNFQRSISNMINQMNSYIDKLSQFYTMWENLGSSLIYELPSQRQEKIDRAAEGRRQVQPQETEQQIKKKLESLPLDSNMRNHYEKKLQYIQEKEDQKRKRLQAGGNLFVKKKSNKGIIKSRNFSLQKTPWYQCSSGERLPFDLPLEILVTDKDQKSYFKYTYEELHRESREYKSELKNFYEQKINNIRQIEAGLGDGYNMLYERKRKNIKVHEMSYSHPQMRFNCWFDRSSTGYMCVLDLPMNLIQKKIQFQIDRQSEMDMMDDKRKKEYNLKQNKINRLDDRKTLLHIGYRFIDEGRELQYLKTDLCKKYNPSYLPVPLQQPPVDQFSDSDHENDENYKILNEVQKQKLPQTKKRTSETQNLTEIKQKFHWFEAKEKEEEKVIVDEETSLFKKFIQVYLPQLQIQQLKKNIEWQTSKSEFFYAPDLKYGELKMRVQENFSAKIFLIDHNYFSKIESLLFHGDKWKLKITLFIVDGEEHKIKTNLQYSLGNQGQLIFYTKIVMKNKFKHEKEQTILGGVMMLQKEEKYEGVGKVKVNFEKQSFENEGLQIGRKALTQFKKYIEKKRNSAE